MKVLSADGPEWIRSGWLINLWIFLG